MVLGPQSLSQAIRVAFTGINETLYFRTASWGVSGNHWRVVLSTDRGLGKGIEFNKDTEYVFNEPDGLLYRIDGHTLEIHSHSYSDPEPLRFKSKAEIRIVNYNSNPDWQEVLRKHKELGLIEVEECTNNQNRIMPSDITANSGRTLTTAGCYRMTPNGDTGAPIKRRPKRLDHHTS